MCTAVIWIPQDLGPVRLLAIRDEDPRREWADLGSHWPEHPQLVGIVDRRAGGAWLAADAGAGRVAVLLNRAEEHPLGQAATLSRGALPLAAVAGHPLLERPPHHGFNLVQLDAQGGQVSTWDGRTVTHTRLAPGVHIVAHDGVDDPATARIARWLPVFRQAAAEPWPEGWLQVLADSGRTDPLDPTALIRDNLSLGIDTRSLLVTLAEITPGAVALRSAVLEHPGHWSTPQWTSPAAGLKP